MIALTDNTFHDFLNEHSIAFIDFYTQYCAPCKALMKFIEGLENEYGNRISFAKVNLEEAEHIANSLEIQSVPCIIIFRDGKETDRVIGNRQAKITELVMGLNNND